MGSMKSYSKYPHGRLIHRGLTCTVTVPPPHLPKWQYIIAAFMYMLDYFIFALGI